MKGVVVLVVVAACGGAVVAPPPLVGHTTDVPAVDTFGDNPMIELAPADTPYAFASFKAIPLDVFRKLFAMNHAAMTKAKASLHDSPVASGILNDLEDLDPAKLAELGLTPSPLIAVYGLGWYPVVRVEIASGDRLYAGTQRRVAAAGETMPAPLVRGGRRYWRVPVLGNEVFVGLGPTEIVIAYAPSAVVTANLGSLLGEKPPASHLVKSTFRALARRDGFSGQGIGFADLARIVALIDGGASSPACRAAIDADVARAPRLVVGYDDVSIHRMGLGTVLELAPELVGEVRDLETELPGADGVMAGRPLFAALERVDLDKGRALLVRLLAEVGALAQTCGDPPAVATIAEATAWLQQPLPPIVAGLRGLYAAFDRVQRVGKGALPSSGYGRVEYADATPIIAAFRWLGLVADRVPRPLPATLSLPGHVAASGTTIAFGLGDDSAAKAASALDGTLGGGNGREPPLALIAMDFSQLGDVFALEDAKPDDDPADAERRHAVLATIGMAVVKLVVDRRGIVATMVMELR